MNQSVEQDQALLSDWAALKAWIEKTCSEVTCYSEQLLGFRANRPGSGALIRVRPVADLTWDYFMIKVCYEASLNPTVALYRSAVIPIGSYCLYDQVLILGERLPFAGLTPALVNRVITALIVERGIFRREIAKSAEEPGDGAFWHMAD